MFVNFLAAGSRSGSQQAVRKCPQHLGTSPPSASLKHPPHRIPTFTSSHRFSSHSLRHKACSLTFLPLRHCCSRLKQSLQSVLEAEHSKSHTSSSLPSSSLGREAAPSLFWREPFPNHLNRTALPAWPAWGDMVVGTSQNCTGAGLIHSSCVRNHRAVL